MLASNFLGLLFVPSDANLNASVDLAWQIICTRNWLSTKYSFEKILAKKQKGLATADVRNLKPETPTGFCTITCRGSPPKPDPKLGDLNWGQLGEVGGTREVVWQERSRL